jgi:GAF domain-containing protein
MTQPIGSWLFDISYPYRSVLVTHRAKGLRVLGWLMAATVLVATVIRVIAYQNTPALALATGLSLVDYSTRWILVTAFVVGMMVVMIALLNRGQYGAGFVVYITILFVIVALSTLIRSTTPEYWLLFLSLPLVAAGVFGDRRSFVIVTVLVISFALCAYPVTQSGIIAIANTAPFSLLEVMVVALVTLSINALTLALGLSAQRALQREFVQMNASVDALADFAKVTLAIGSLDDIFTDTVELIREKMGYHFAQIFVTEPQTNLLVLRARSGVNPVQIASNRQRITSSDAHIFNRVMSEAVSRRVALAHAATDRVAWLPTTKAQLIIPIMRGTQVSGVLDVQSADPEAFRLENTRTLETVALQLAFSIREAALAEQLRAVSEQQRANAKAQSLTDADQRPARPSSEGALQGRLERALGFDWHNGMMVANTAVTPAQHRALTNAMPETFEDGDERGLTVPILLRGQPLGALEFRVKRSTGWNSRQIELARVIAQRLALALDNLRLFEQAQITANRERVASQLSARLQTRTDVDSLLGMATETLQVALGATRTSIRFGSLDLPDAAPTLPATGTNGQHQQGSNDTP